MSEDSTRAATPTTGASERETGAEPAVRSDDGLFFVIETRLLEELLAVIAPLETDAVLCAGDGEGIQLRSRTENCHWLELHVDTEHLSQFRTDGVNRQVDVTALGEATTSAVGDRVAIRASNTEELRLADGSEEFDIWASEVPVEREHNPLMETVRMTNKIEFTLDSARLQALVEANATADHIRFAAETPESTAEVGFYDTDDGSGDPVLEIDRSSFHAEPTVRLGDGPAEKQRLVCRESITEAMPPMEGPVEVGITSDAGHGVNFKYRRANGAVTACSILSKRQEASLD